MAEESENSDSWGSMLINAILVKSGLISGEKSNNRNVIQEHQLVGSKKPKTVKDASNDLVDHKVVDDLNPKSYGRSKYQEIAPKPINEPWLNKSMGNFSSRKKEKSSNRSTDFIEKKYDMERNSSIHSTDIIENQIDLDKVSLAPTKSNDSAPAQ